MLHLTSSIFAGASSYIVTVTSDDNTGVFLPAPISTTELFTAISKLSHGTRYSFSVRAVGVQKQESSRTPSIVRVIGKQNLIIVAEFTPTSLFDPDNKAKNSA